MTSLGLHPLDLAIVLAYLALTFGVGLYFSRRASKSTEEYFVSGRSLPWWIAGTSMVATTFAADTPIAVSGLVAKGGIYSNWMWLFWGIGGVVGVFLFARLWNRTGVTTDAEFIELRYDGAPATALRCYKAIWFGLFQNVLVIAWVMLAMCKILVTVMGWDEETRILGLEPQVAVVLGLFLLTVFYTILSGLWGVVATDVLQFCIAMGGCIYLACAAWARIGGAAALKDKLAAAGFDVERTLRIVPEAEALTQATPFAEFLIFILVLWWADVAIDGRGYIAQRLLAAKDERHAMLAYLWYSIAHICLRPWPWIVVGLCGMAFFGPLGPDGDVERYYPMMMREVLPAGLFGVMLAAFLAAFMSTIDTHLNWGASTLVTDVYRRFFRRGRSEREYIIASRAVVAGLALLGAIVSLYLRDIADAWAIYITATAGVGLVHMARWYWWRVNAWSEIAAFATALAGIILVHSLAAPYGDAPPPLLQFPYSTALIVCASIPIWITVTFLTRPASQAHLVRFYRKVHPGGRGWRRIAALVPGSEKDGPRPATFLRIALGIAALYAVLIGSGKLILGETGLGATVLAGGVAAFAVLGRTMRRR